jgi:hypothetical protein
MQAPHKEDGAERRPRLSVVISELRLRESDLGRLTKTAAISEPGRPPGTIDRVL